MKDDIDNRLQEASSRCIDAYAAWCKQERDQQAREELREAIHELRKVSSRLEIEMAVSEREEMAQKPIPIPSHRASRIRKEKSEGGAKSGQSGKLSAGEENGGSSNEEKPSLPRGRKSASANSSSNAKAASGNGDGSEGPEVEKIKTRGRRKSTNQRGGGNRQ